MIKKIPFFLTILGMFGGVAIAIVFGVNEELFLSKIKAGLQGNVKIQSIQDTAERERKIETETSKNWRYYQRYHFHATGISAMALALLLFLQLSLAPSALKTFSSYTTSLGGFFYPFVWLFAGIYGPQMGRSEAKEAFAVFGYMGGVFLIGVLACAFIALKYPTKISNS